MVLTSACELLSFFKVVTEEMSSENIVTISQIILISNALKREGCKFLAMESLPETVRQMAQVLFDELSMEFYNIEENNILVESTLLESRFNLDLKYMVFKMTLHICKHIQIKNSSITLRYFFFNYSDAEKERQPRRPNKKTCSIEDEFDGKESAIIQNSNRTAAGIIEVDKHLQEPIAPRNKDQLKWWQEKKDVTQDCMADSLWNKIVRIDTI